MKVDDYNLFEGWAIFKIGKHQLTAEFKTYPDEYGYIKYFYYLNNFIGLYGDEGTKVKLNNKNEIRVINEIDRLIQKHNRNI